MPKSTKPHMSNDELDGFDFKVLSVQFVDGNAVLVIQDENIQCTLYIDEVDCNRILSFIRRNKA